ncbi:MAG TPA: hypothetical protein VLI69_03565 [Gammaproteobacteria bacterium]|nr:hypothetical protein [Gammaproteobacteria bacterium]
MLLRRFTDFVLRGRLQAIGAAFVLSLVPLFGASMGVLVAAFVTLRRGALEGTLVLCAVIAPYLLSYAISPKAAQPQLMMVATVTIIAINVLTGLLAVILRRYSNWNLVIEASILAGVVLVCIIHLVFPEVQNWWGAELTAYLKKTAAMIGQFAPDEANAQEALQANMIASIKRYITGFVIASVIFNALLQLVIARWWQAIIFNPGGLRKELHQIRLSYISASVFIAVLGLAYIDNPFSLDMMPIMVTAFCAAGLSLIHCLLLSNKAGWFWLILVYLGMIFVFPAGIIFIAMTGLLDSLFNLRKHLRRMNP